MRNYWGTLREVYEYLVFSVERAVNPTTYIICTSISQIKGFATDICGRHAIRAERKVLGLLPGESNCKLYFRRIVWMFMESFSGCNAVL